MKASSKVALMAECRKVGRTLQEYLDGMTDDATTERVERHLDACRRCGFEVSTYRALKASLARRGPRFDELALARLRTFAAQLSDGPSPSRP